MEERWKNSKERDPRTIETNSHGRDSRTHETDTHGRDPNIQTQKNAGGGGASRKQKRMTSGKTGDEEKFSRGQSGLLRGASRKQKRMTSGKTCAKKLRKKYCRSLEWKKHKEEFTKAKVRSRNGPSRKSNTTI